ncbi:hypothetical protein THASP1DRAFT_28713 [Thamnocephalis sphaerospora]|uniref:Uncharacterized protein n=1 Tax=Thamnocephalis sphaerospora TaxID=78915 RepID=A0A4P9XVQ0_9FUNG|nr:hypothetical protein THASP1DRAFT_28713 [Thamnocephalis sphaerospora]|eukprot:RKP09490.1 hypothetical protein THASP1DRAFT_28713 [Thamnocephalis sphaerospora]
MKVFRRFARRSNKPVKTQADKKKAVKSNESVSYVLASAPVYSPASSNASLKHSSPTGSLAKVPASPGGASISTVRRSVSLTSTLHTTETKCEPVAACRAPSYSMEMLEAPVPSVRRTQIQPFSSHLYVQSTPQARPADPSLAAAGDRRSGSMTTSKQTHERDSVRRHSRHLDGTATLAAPNLPASQYNSVAPTKSNASSPRQQRRGVTTLRSTEKRAQSNAKVTQQRHVHDGAQILDPTLASYTLAHACYPQPPLSPLAPAGPAPPGSPSPLVAPLNQDTLKADAIPEHLGNEQTVHHLDKTMEENTMPPNTANTQSTADKAPEDSDSPCNADVDDDEAPLGLSLIQRALVPPPNTPATPSAATAAVTARVRLSSTLRRHPMQTMTRPPTSASSAAMRTPIPGAMAHPLPPANMPSLFVYPERINHWLADVSRANPKANEVTPSPPTSARSMATQSWGRDDISLCYQPSVESFSQPPSVHPAAAAYAHSHYHGSAVSNFGVPSGYHAGFNGYDGYGGMGYASSYAGSVSGFGGYGGCPSVASGYAGSEAFGSAAYRPFIAPQLPMNVTMPMSISTGLTASMPMSMPSLPMHAPYPTMYGGRNHPVRERWPGMTQPSEDEHSRMARMATTRRRPPSLVSAIPPRSDQRRSGSVSGTVARERPQHRSRSFRSMVPSMQPDMLMGLLPSSMPYDATGLPLSNQKLVNQAGRSTSSRYWHNGTRSSVPSTTGRSASQHASRRYERTLATGSVRMSGYQDAPRNCY